jgi:hypothetical protein
MLKEIGGSEAAVALRQALRATADPFEMAIIGCSLEEMAPGEHRQEVLAAARDMLNSAAEKQARDVAPLFQLIQTYGDMDSVPDLQKNMSRWGYYAVMALAGLPDEQGLPALIEMVQNAPRGASGNSWFALQMLAEMAPRSADAQAVLIGQTRLNLMPDAAWKQIAMGLAGEQHQFMQPLTGSPASARDAIGQKTYHIALGNQNFRSTPLAGREPQEILEARVLLIDQLLAVSASPVAAEALEAARKSLLKR